MRRLAVGAVQCRRSPESPQKRYAQNSKIMKVRQLEYFVAAAEELNFTHAADRLHVSQPPFSKQIHDLEGELAIGYMAALTHEFLGKAFQLWRLIAPDIVLDCVEMDCISQERALLDGRIAVGLLVPSDRPLLELLQVRFLIKYRVRLALPKCHPLADRPEIFWTLLKDEPFIGLNRMYPNYGEWLLKVCRRVGFKPRIVKEADGAASALAFVAAGFGGAVG